VKEEGKKRKMSWGGEQRPKKKGSSGEKTRPTNKGGVTLLVLKKKIENHTRKKKVRKKPRPMRGPA